MQPIRKSTMSMHLCFDIWQEYWPLFACYSKMKNENPSKSTALGKCLPWHYKQLLVETLQFKSINPFLTFYFHKAGVNSRLVKMPFIHHNFSISSICEYRIFSLVKQIFKDWPGIITCNKCHCCKSNTILAQLFRIC